MKTSLWVQAHSVCMLGAIAVTAAAFTASCSGPSQPCDACSESSAGRREIPLNRHRLSRSAQEDPEGFYYQSVGLADDYPEETTTSAKIQRDFEVLKDTGVDVFRFAFGWDSIEEEPGEYNWRFWDEVVETAQRTGITLIPYVCYTPRWAATRPVEYWRQPPRDPSRFGRFMSAIVGRYKSVIPSWEIWNEPDLEAYWLGDAQKFAGLVIEGAKGVRSADPQAVLVLGGMAHGRGTFFDTLLRQHQLHAWVDVINMHGYRETWNEERAEGYPKDIEQMAAATPAFGPDLWMAEFGYSNYRFAPDKASEWGVDVVYAYEHTAEYQAVALFKHHVLALAPEELSLTAWYRIHDLPVDEEVIGDDNNKFLGVIDIQGQPKPAFHAMKLYTRLFDEPVRRIDDRVRIVAPGGSQSILHVFEEKSGGLLLTGWLRSSRRDEVIDRSGFAVDRRREIVAVELPGKSYGRAVVYDVRGHVIQSTARLSEGVLRDVRLTGDQVFIAEILPQK